MQYLHNLSSYVWRNNRFNRFEEVGHVKRFQCHFRIVDLARDALYVLATPTISDWSKNFKNFVTFITGDKISWSFDTQLG